MKKGRFFKRSIAAALAIALLLPVLTVGAGAASSRPKKGEKEKDRSVLEEGDTVTFGAYEQDDILMNGDEPIEWYVLYADEEQALLLSKYALFAGSYHENWASLTWDKCSLREWLNDEFYESAFSSDEQDAIFTSILPGEKNPVYKTTGGEETEDNVFVLSISEAAKFLKEDRLLECEPTEYAITCGTRVSKDGTCWYWLRSPGEDRTKAAYVTTKVTINEKGVTLEHSDAGVRPAIWVDVTKLDG